MASETAKGKCLVWFRNDLRVHDHPALRAAAESGQSIVGVYILSARHGGAAGWWLQASLDRLMDTLRDLNIPLVLRRGDSAAILPALAEELGARTIHTNATGFPDDRATDETLHGILETHGVRLRSFHAATLVRPDTLTTKNGTDFKVFTPFWKALSRETIRTPLPVISPQLDVDILQIASDTLADWALQPTTPDWAARFPEFWTPGEAGARAQLARFLDQRADGYASKRDRPDIDGTARISPHLAFGEISPRQVWHAAMMNSDRVDTSKFLSELAWRDFSYYLLHHRPDLESENFRPAFDHFAWRDDDAAFKAWCRGETGYPLVDAGMRQLWQTGWMHNRVRMVAASFLVKHLLIDWRRGLDWFADTLVDHDRASNAASWQWVAGCGADAAPYFRIFNPIAQGQKFDPNGDYVRTWCPELAHLSVKHIHAPFEASGSELARAGINLGSTYPRPIVEHAAARQRALDSYQTLKANA